MDGTPSLPNLKHMTNAFQRVLIGTTGRLPPFFEENERSQEQPEGVPSSLPNQEPSIQEPPSVQGSPTEASFQQDIMDDFIIQLTPIQKEKPKSEPKETPETEPSHHFTTEQDLSGVPFDIYATPESYIHQTSLLDESTKAE